MTTKKLTRRQACWAEFLSGFNFVISYTPGKENQKADSLTRRPNDFPSSENDDRQQHQLQTLLPAKRLEISSITMGENTTIIEQVVKANLEDDYYSKLCHSLETGHLVKEIDLHYFSHLSVDSKNCICQYGQLWVPEDLYSLVLREVHDQIASGHPGRQKTVSLLAHNYYWPKMKDTVYRYIRNCYTCRRAKAPRDQYNGLLKPLPIPTRPWTDVTLDFVTGLPHSNGYNAVLMVIDRLTKKRYYISCTTDKNGTTAEATAYLLLNNVWKLHDLPLSLTSDRGPQFISEIWKNLCKILGIKVNLFTAFYPETNGQSEIANQEMKRHFCTFVNYQQDD